MQGVLVTLHGWQIMLLIVAILLLYLIAVIHPRIRRFAKNNTGVLAGGLPGIGDTSTLIGLVLAALAVVASFIQNQPLAKFEAILFFLTGAVIFLFFYLFFRQLIVWWGVYFSIGTISSGWYCLAWSLFALLDVLLPDRSWRFVLLVAPASMFVSAVLSLILMLQAQAEGMT